MIIKPSSLEKVSDQLIENVLDLDGLHKFLAPFALISSYDIHFKGNLSYFLINSGKITALWYLSSSATTFSDNIQVIRAHAEYIRYKITHTSEHFPLEVPKLTPPGIIPSFTHDVIHFPHTNSLLLTSSCKCAFTIYTSLPKSHLPVSDAVIQEQTAKLTQHFIHNHFEVLKAAFPIME